MLVDALIEVFSGMLSALTGVSQNIIEIFYHKKQILKDDKKKQEELSQKLDRLTASLPLILASKTLQSVKRHVSKLRF